MKVDSIVTMHNGEKFFIADETFQNNNPHFYQAADENGKLLENCKILSN